MQEPAPEALEPETSEQDYFDSYADPGVHRLMIADHARTDAYRRALEAAVEPGMTVLDVGTGTGILSFFAARAGAARVYAVDRSSILDSARELAAINGLSERVTFLHGRVEEIELPEPVDLIVSEWMGFFALAECMFLSVVSARDRHLADGGRVLPSRVRLMLAPVQDDELHHDRGIGLWEKPVYGFDFSAMIERELKELLTTAVDLKPEMQLGRGRRLVEIDCTRAAANDFFFDASVDLEIERDGVLHGLGGWFDADLAGGVVLSTSPAVKQTHWRQSFFPVRPVPVRAGDVLTIEMRATPREYGDRRLPLYFTDGWLVRQGVEVHRFFYCHGGSFE